MYFRCSKKQSDGKMYNSVQLVRTVPNPETGRPTTRVVASMGNLIGLPESKRLQLVRSLARVLGVHHRFRILSDQPTLFDERSASKAKE